MKAAQLTTVGIAAHGNGHGAKPLNLQAVFGGGGIKIVQIARPVYRFS